jgi:DNA-directed RNA polymerase specialized sigma24 family protein
MGNSDELTMSARRYSLKMYQNLKRSRGGAPFENWLPKIAVDACYGALGMQRRKASEAPLGDIALSPGDSREEIGSDKGLAIIKIVRPGCVRGPVGARQR